MYLGATAGTRSTLDGATGGAIRSPRSTCSGCRISCSRRCSAIGDPRTDKRIDFVGGIRGPAELERLVDSGEAAVAFAMYPDDGRTTDGDCRRGRNHAAEVHVVRAEVARRVVDARDLNASASVSGSVLGLGRAFARLAGLKPRPPTEQRGNRRPKTEDRSNNDRSRRGQVRAERSRRPESRRLRGGVSSRTLKDEGAAAAIRRHAARTCSSSDRRR